MGAGFIGFWVVNLGLLVNVFYPETNPFLGLICILAILTITITSLVEGKSLYIKKLEIFSTKVEKEIRLIFISDTHLGSNSKDHLKKIISKVQSLEFDLLLIGGDFIDSGSFDLDDLDLLKAVNRPILFISGNHEYYLKDYEHKLKRLKNYNVIFLNNEAYKYKKLQVIGICDNETVSSQEMITNKLVKDGFFNLVLVHKPSLWDQVCKEIDLMLSGHTHNGQIFPFNFFVRMRFRYIYGLYEKLNSKLYVSSGSGCWGPKMRLGTRNEIVNIIISRR